MGFTHLNIKIMEKFYILTFLFRKQEAQQQIAIEHSSYHYSRGEKSFSFHTNYKFPGHKLGTWIFDQITSLCQNLKICRWDFQNSLK